MIKPLRQCQFKCSFCSAYQACIEDNETARDKIIGIVNQMQPNDIIVTGGEPLLLDPSFYNKLLSINNTATISITSNLWDFYLHPNKWKSILSNQRVGIITSFQYGDGRLKPDGTPYSEDDFIKVITKFKDEIGYSPSFISVINSKNYDYAIDHVRLAKRLGITCKLNSQLPIGKSNEYFPRHKLLKLYFKIIDLGLGQYEDNIVNRSLGKCPFNTLGNCKAHNRAAIVINDDKVAYSYCEDLLLLGHYVDDIGKIDQIHDLSHIKPITPDCYACKLYAMCNLCYVNKYSAIYDKQYCNSMKQIEDDLVKYGFVS